MATDSAIAETARPRTGRKLLVPLLSLPMLALFLPFLVVPLLLLIRISVGGGRIGFDGFTLDRFAAVLGDTYYLSALGITLLMALLTAAGCLLLSIPLAYFMLRQPRWRMPIIAALIGPLVISVVVRLYGWQLLLSESGPVNNTIALLFGDDARVMFIGSWSGVIITMIHTLMPYMCIAIFNSMQSMGSGVTEAAQTLGASAWQVFLKVVLPLAARGIMTGTVLVFSLSATSFIVPAVMGAGRVNTFPMLIYQEATELNFPSAAALAVVLLVLLLPLSALSTRGRNAA